MVDLHLLNNTISEHGVTIVSIAEKIGISREGLYKKLSGESEFKASEIEKMTSALRLSKEGLCPKSCVNLSSNNDLSGDLNQ